MPVPVTRKTSDEGVYAKGVVLVVLNCDQGVVGIVGDEGRGGGGDC